MSIYRHYGEHKEKDNFLFDISSGILVLSRNSKNLKDVLQNIDTDKRKECLIIHDEIHAFGSESFKKISW